MLGAWQLATRVPVFKSPVYQNKNGLGSGSPLLLFKSPVEVFQMTVCLFVCCLMSQQHASVSQGWICADNFTCCHTEIKVADQTFYLTQSQSTDTRSTSPSADPIMPGAWQGSHWSANFYVIDMTRSGKILLQAGFESWIFRSQGGCRSH